MRREFNTPGGGRQQWPDSVAYREAIQSPEIVLGDAQLAGAQVTLNRQGLPLAYTGRFAVVFRLKTNDGASWALRCFTSPADPMGLARAVRYHILASRIASVKDIVVPFRFIERGVRVTGQWFPAIAMEWASGRPLGRWVEENLDKPEALRTLAVSLGKLLERLESETLAHGDWQHDNLLVDASGAKVTLVDYDGMFVPELAGYPSPEIGHPNYQHPARTERHYGPGLDRFSCLVMQTALLALAKDPALWSRHGDGESLLFRSADFKNPGGSRLLPELKALAELDRDSELAESIARLEDALRAGPDSALLPVISTEPPRPIDLATLPIPEGWVALAQSAERLAQSVTGGHWWQESVVEAASTGMSFVAQATTQANTAQDEARLEGRHLWAHRAILTALSLFFIWRIFGLSADWLSVLGLLTPLLWLGLATAGGYADWPKRKAHAELDEQVARMRKQIHDRQLSREKARSAVGPAAFKAAQGTADDFLAEKLGKLDVNRILGDGRINAATLDAVKAEGIKTALELRNRTNLASVPPHQIALLQQWCREREAELADEWRRLIAQSRSAGADLQRLELEIASFEEEIERLDQERQALPKVDLTTYLKRLVGM